MRILHFFSLGVLFAIAPSLAAASPAPKEIIDKTISRYRWMSSFACDGKINASVRDVANSDAETSFSMRMARPNLYQIAWTASREHTDYKGAVVNAGGGMALLYPGFGPCIQAGFSDAQALGSALDVSAGAIGTIPPLFFNMFAGASRLSELEKPELVRTQKINDEDCYLIQGSSPASTKHQFWISVEKYLILRERCLYDRQLPAPGIWDDAPLPAAGAAPSSSSLQTVQKLLKTVSDSNQVRPVSWTADFKNVRVDQPIAKEAFNWQVPKGSQLKMKTLGAGSGGSFAVKLKVKEGEKAPDFTGKTLDGKEVKLSDFRGKIVVIDFWATWCGPCVHEIPNVAKAYEKYHPQGVQFIGVSLDNSESKLQGFLAKHPEVKWMQLFEGKGWKSGIADQYGVSAIPQLMLIEPDGKIHAVSLRGNRIGEAIEEVLTANKSK